MAPLVHSNAIFVLCGLFVTEGAQNLPVLCLLKGNVSHGTEESSEHPFWVRRCFYFPRFLQKNFRITNCCRDWPFLRRLLCFKLPFSTAFSRPVIPSQEADDGAGETNEQNKNKQTKAQPVCVWYWTLPRFWPVLRPFQMSAVAASRMHCCFSEEQTCFVFIWVQEQFVKRLPQTVNCRLPPPRALPGPPSLTLWNWLPLLNFVFSDLYFLCC